MKTTDWCWPTLATIEMEQGRLADAEKHISAAVRSKSERCLQPFDSWLPEIPPGKIRRRARRIEPRGESSIHEILKSKLSRRHAQSQKACARRRKRRCARRFNSTPNYGPAHNNLAVIYIQPVAALGGTGRAGIIKRRSTPASRTIRTWRKMLDAKGAPANPPIITHHVSL